MDVLGSREVSVTELAELSEEKRLLFANLHILDEKELFVLKLRYGLDGSPRLAQRQIAAKLGISRSYISRIEKKAITKLKKAINKD